jgi:glycosyltransferase involved in cell wall biosynthesis
MRILINEFCGHAFQIELSRELARRGHEVLHVYFADNHSTPKGDVEGGSGNLTIEGLHVPMAFCKHSLRTRRKVDVAYGRAVAAKVAEFKPDTVISANMPLDAQKILQDASRKHGARFIFWLQDVYSSAIRFVLQRKLGAVAGLAASYYQWLEARMLRKSDGVVCISPAFRKIAKDWGVKPERLFVIENWAPLDEVVPTPKNNAWSVEHGVDKRFCFMYSGTLGMKHRPELLLALARHLAARGDARLVVIAAGAGAEWLATQAASVPGDTLTMLPFQPYKKLSEVMGSADALIALLDSEAGAFAVPSKVLSYLCAGRALLVAAPRENHVIEVLENADAGLVISPDNLGDFVMAAEKLMNDHALRQRFAANARAYAERTFDIVRTADRFLEVAASCPTYEEPALQTSESFS